MVRQTSPARGRFPAAVPAMMLAGLALGLILLFSAVPSGPAGGGPQQGPLSPPSAPLAASVQTSGNAHLGELWHLSVLTRPEVGVWILASSNSGPSFIGPFAVDLSADWFLLQDFSWTGGGNRVDLDLPIPANSALLGAEVIVQSFLFRPATLEMHWTNSVLHRLTAAPPQGRSVLVVRQAASSVGGAAAAVEADALAQNLQTYGHAVTVVDDVLPVDLAGYDALLDCRFTLPPDDGEKLQMVRFLQRYGGIFLVCGPYLGSPGGQARLAWIRDLLNTKLGIPVIVGSGGNASAAGTEEVSALSDPRYLTFPATVSGLAYHVENEGGSFGPLGYATVGQPWIVATGAPHTVYGMFFKASDVPAVSVRGTLAVLFNGASGALSVSAANPNVHLLFANLPWYLDH